MANIARITVEAKINRLMASYANNSPTQRTLKFITPLVILMDNKSLEENPNLAKNAPKYTSNGVQIWEEESLEVIPLD